MLPENANIVLTLSAELTEHVNERAQAISVLRDICPDNDWPDDLHLADIIEKYVRPHMPAPVAEPELEFLDPHPNLWNRAS